MSVNTVAGELSGSGAPALLVHGGAWDIPNEEVENYEEGLTMAVERGRSLLERGLSSIDVVTEVVAAMEVHGAFDAGSGSVLTRDGTVELDAGLMDGHTMAFGAVAAVSRLPQPVRVAHKLLSAGEGQVRLMTGAGAERFAEENGFELVSNDQLICARERRRFRRLQERYAYHTSHNFLSDAPSGTVGCVALDAKGRLAAATSTGGTPFRPSGRVGDSPLPGCGFYATRDAAASATGWGEAVATVLLSGRAVADVEAGQTVADAVAVRLRQLNEKVHNLDGEGATGGLILIDREGRACWAYTTPRMARAGWRAGGEPWVSVS